jgi:hypothetical protein
MNLSITLGNDFSIGIKPLNGHDELWPALDISRRKQAIKIETEVYDSIFGLTKC